jgi:hypothetical protein
MAKAESSDTATLPTVIPSATTKELKKERSK